MSTPTPGIQRCMSVSSNAPPILPFVLRRMDTYLHRAGSLAQPHHMACHLVLTPLFEIPPHSMRISNPTIYNHMMALWSRSHETCRRMLIHHGWKIRLSCQMLASPGEPWNSNQGS